MEYSAWMTIGLIFASVVLLVLKMETAYLGSKGWKTYISTTYLEVFMCSGTCWIV